MLTAISCAAVLSPRRGIIDSIACMEPLVIGFGRGAMAGFPFDPLLPMDVVPVDVAINGSLAAIADSAGKPGTRVYQIGTSKCNPLRESFRLSMMPFNNAFK